MRDFRAYKGASWPDEPTESDFLSSHPTLEQARAALAVAPSRGGFGDYVINHVLGVFWKDSDPPRSTISGKEI